MPTYLYQEILPDGSPGACFEVFQRMADPPLSHHPVSGCPVKKVFSSPNLPNKYSDSEMRKPLTDENVAAHGFTRYEKDKLTGKYHKTAGNDKNAPDCFDGQNAID